MTLSSTALSELESEDVVDDDDEEALFVEMEKAEEEDITNPSEQPKDISAAPRLLQQALEHGDVPADESSEGEEAKEEQVHDNNNNNNKMKSEETNGGLDATAIVAIAEAVVAASPHRVHSRVRFLW
jgi:hypothetical protein